MNKRNVKSYIRVTKAGRLFVDKKEFIRSGELDRIIDEVRNSNIYKKIENNKGF